MTKRIKGRVVVSIIALAIIAAFILTMFMPTMAQAKLLKKNGQQIEQMDPGETYTVIDKQSDAVYIKSVGYKFFVTLTLEDETGNRLYVTAETMKNDRALPYDVIKEGKFGEKTAAYDSAMLTIVGDEIQYDEQNMMVVVE